MQDKYTDDLLEVNELKMHFPIRGGIFQRQVGKVFAVDGISLGVGKGKTLGLVGESGCGKTTVGRCILRLYEPTGGRVIFEGKNLLGMDRRNLRAVRRNLQMIFQDPFESLNSRHVIANIIEEPFIVHRMGTPRQRRKWVYKLLERVGLARDAALRFPHEFSGGQRQRIGIARAIALNPKLIVCDEPVSALDVSIQSQVLNLLLELQQDMELSYLFIAHDLSVVKHISDTIAVMYLGRIVEQAPADDLYEMALHPYTQALIAAIPIADPSRKRDKKPLSGDVPSPINPPQGCHFHPRCPFVIDLCRQKEPFLKVKPENGGSDHWVACHRAGKI
ncbi:MAG: ABC transporter ATP-binding protein [Desulfobacteraceae bacterium]|nr:ABC transporter ATP-binding protein [Desulfobacteraceae bacterium]